MGVKVNKDAMSVEEFRALVKRLSKYHNFHGCESVEDIEDKIREKIKMYEDKYENTPPVFKKARAQFKRSAKRWRRWLKGGLAFRLQLESWINPHPVYKEILGMDDEIYNDYVEKKKKSDKELKEMGLK